MLSCLDYCCTVWGNSSNELISDCIKFQKRAARIILDKTYETPSEDLFKKLNWMKFDERIKYKKAIIMFNSVNDVSYPQYMKKQIQVCNSKTWA